MQRDELAKSRLVRLWLIDARHDVEHSSFGIANIGSNVAMESASEHVAAAEVDSHDWHTANGHPDGLEVLIDVRRDLVVGEQHGSRQAGVRSAELVVEIAHHLKQQYRLA